MIVTIANQKGGVGKSTTAASLGAALSEGGHRVLLVDLDPQGSGLGRIIGLAAPPGRSLYEVLVSGSLTLADVIIERPGLWLAPAGPRLAGAVAALSATGEWLSVLSTALQPINGSFDDIVIDTPPSLGGTLLPAALVAAEWLLVPTTLTPGPVAAARSFVSMAEADRAITSRNRRLRPAGLVPTMVDARRNIERQALEHLAALEESAGRSLLTPIPRRVEASEAEAFGQTIFEYAPRSAVAVAYRTLAGELLSLAGER